MVDHFGLKRCLLSQFNLQSLHSHCHNHHNDHHYNSSKVILATGAAISVDGLVEGLTGRCCLTRHLGRNYILMKYSWNYILGRWWNVDEISSGRSAFPLLVKLSLSSDSPWNRSWSLSLVEILLEGPWMKSGFRILGWNLAWGHLVWILGWESSIEILARGRFGWNHIFKSCSLQATALSYLPALSTFYRWQNIDHQTHT